MNGRFELKKVLSPGVRSKSPWKDTYFRLKLLPESEGQLPHIENGDEVELLISVDTLIQNATGPYVEKLAALLGFPEKTPAQIDKEIGDMPMSENDE